MAAVRHLPTGILRLAILGALLGVTSHAGAAQFDLELFAPGRDASRALQSAHRARAADLAPRDLQLADLYFADATAALNPASGPPDAERAARLFRVAAAAAKVAETRSVEIVRERDAAAAGNQFLDVIEGDPKRMLPPRPPLAMAQGEYRRLQQEAAAARAARRAAEAALEQLRSQVR